MIKDGSLTPDCNFEVDYSTTTKEISLNVNQNNE